MNQQCAIGREKPSNDALNSHHWDRQSRCRVTRVAVLLVAEFELAFVIGAPQLILLLDVV